MTDRVVCAECNDSYDSDEHPFCPRCGATRTAETPQAAVRIANRQDPRRRRVQAAGIMMAATGGMVAAFGLVLLFMGGGLADTMFADGVHQPSAPLDITVTDAGVPVADLNVTVTTAKGTTAWAFTDGNGTVSFPMQDDAVLELTAGDWSGRFAAIGLAADEPFVLDLDLQDGPAAPLMDKGLVRTAILTIGGLAAFMAIGPLVGGISAIRLRAHTMAFAGAILGVIPWLVITLMSPFLGLLMLGCYVAAAVFIRQGRGLFTS